MSDAPQADSGRPHDGAAAPRIMAAAPIVPVRDVRASIDFYVSMLGFQTVFLAADGATGEVGRDGARVMFVACDDADTLAVTASNMSIYMQVNNVDALWHDLSPRLGDLPKNRVRAPFDQAYGMREFHVKDPDGFLMFFGQPVR